MSQSLQYRLTLSASVVLAAFLGLAGFTLDRAYRQGQNQAMQERLQIHIYALMGAADVDQKGHLTVQSDLQEPRFNLPDSGLIAYIVDEQSTLVWRSTSSIGFENLPTPELSAGQRQFLSVHEQSLGLNALHYQVRWEAAGDQNKAYQFVVAESPQSQLDQLGGFRQILWLGLGGVGCLLVVVQGFVLRWSLKPVRSMVTDLEQIQMGQREQLQGDYGRELAGIASTINKLIENERAHLQRYRNTLSDLAHSLKTPLSVLSGLYQQGEMGAEERAMLQQQTGRMREMVDYQLHRAAASGHQTLTALVEINPIFEQLQSSLNKVYRDKSLVIDLDLPQGLKYFCESADLYELAGNLMDNACKWASHKVRVVVEAVRQPEWKGTGLQLLIEDDGPGLPPERIDELLQRGVRADQQVAGHGIGLAVVSDLVALYQGKMESIQSSLGGQCWRITLPSRI